MGSLSCEGAVDVKKNLIRGLPQNKQFIHRLNMYWEIYDRSCIMRVDF